LARVNKLVETISIQIKVKDLN